MSLLMLLILPYSAGCPTSELPSAPLVLLMGRLRLGRMFQSFDVLTNRPTADTVVITVMLDTVPPVGPIPVRRTGEH